ncbi:MAG: hypothetical protein SFH39_00395 [Candidatus Magnetobacterium sp. LHC-1]
MPDPIEDILEQLYSDGSYDEEFPTDPNRNSRVKQARHALAKVVREIDNPHEKYNPAWYTFRAVVESIAKLIEGA